MLLCFVPDAGCDAGASYPAYGLFNSLMLLDFVGRIRRFRRIRQPVFTRAGSFATTGFTGWRFLANFLLIIISL